MDIINQLYDESNKKHEALASSLEQRASALHGQLLAEIGTLNHDIFHRGFASAADPMVQSSKQFVESNMIERERAGGPSIRRFKFHPSYWKYWHGEKTVLDHISRERHAQLEREKNAKRVISDKERQARARKDRAAFTNTNVNANSKFFDQHLLGDTSVPYILQKSLHQPVISEESLDPAFNMVYPHHRRTPVRNGKTISFGRAPKASGRDRVRSETSSCDIPPLPSAFDKDQGKGLGFSSAKRFPSLDNSAAAAAVPPQSQNAPLSSSMRLSTPSAAPSSSSSLGFHFPQAPRFVKEMPSATGAVGPGEYPLPRLLDPSKEQAEALRKVFEKYNTQRSHGLIDWQTQELCGMGKLGKGCSIEDHVLYGMCRDRNCFQRALFEKTAMAANDRLRLRGYQPKTFFANELLRAERERLKGKYQYPKDLDGQAAGVEGEEVEEDEEDLSLRLRKESASDRYLVSAWPMLPEPIYAMTALYAAAVFNDLPTIKKLGEMGINPNVAQPDTGYTPLHIAAIKRYHQAVYYLLHYFHNPQSSVGAGNQHHWLNINARDLHGNTALHYASRQGCEEVVAMLCQEEDIDPEVTNDFGQRPLDIIGNHQVFSYLKLAMERNALKRELASIQKLPVASAAATTTAALRTSRRSQRSTQKQ